MGTASIRDVSASTSAQAGARRPSLSAARLLPLVAVVAAFFTPIARAQERPSSFEYAFANPGARSLGFAGAFAPLADDATAAFANPAGLVQLLRSELSGELRLSLVSGAEEEPVTDMKGLSYVSLVVPGSRWSVALFAHHLASFEFSSGEPAAGEAFAPTFSRALQNETQTTQLDIARYGLAGGYRVSESLSLGLGISYFEGNVEGSSTSSSTGDCGCDGLDPDTSDWAYNAGFLWSVSDRWSLGGFYREGPEFRLAAATETGPGASEDTSGQGIQPLSLPDAFGLGSALRLVNGALTVAFEWDRIEYSDLTESLDGGVASGGRLLLDDADELHLGAEWAFLDDMPVIALRAGIWYEPSHRAWRHDDGSSRTLDDDLFHQTFGVGWAWRRSQLDFGLDMAEHRLVLSVSAIFSF